MFKNMAKTIIVQLSWFFARAYVKKFNPIIIGVTGSVGKSGTKRAIAHVISAEKKVAWQDGNYNEIVTVPLVFFGLSKPSLFNPIAWVGVYLRMISQIAKSRGADVVVLELGTDAPGQIAEFGRYLRLDYAVVTAITPEHMENFSSINDVANEELTVLNFAQKGFVDQSIVDAGYIKLSNDIKSYGSSNKSNISYRSSAEDLIIRTSRSTIKTKPMLQGSHQFGACAIAAFLAQELGLSDENITQAIRGLIPMPGRMQPLIGKDGSRIIDDTYNASPEAIKAALEYLYVQPEKHKVAIIGNMNEMGPASVKLHRELAKYINPDKLNQVITIGPDANKYFAPAVKELGCKVSSFDSPIEIGSLLASEDLSDTILLFKGSQNRVFLEEAIKPILANPSDSSKLVRQSSYWLKRKRAQFRGKS